MQIPSTNTLPKRAKMKELPGSKRNMEFKLLTIIRKTRWQRIQMILTVITNLLAIILRDQFNIRK